LDWGVARRERCERVLQDREADRRECCCSGTEEVFPLPSEGEWFISAQRLLNEELLDQPSIADELHRAAGVCVEHLRGSMPIFV
jgi:hypothetical protein